LLREIREQPAAILDTLKAERGGIPRAAKFLGRRSVHFLGMGSSYCASLYAQYLFQELAQRRTEVHVASEFIHYPPRLASSDVFVAISQSGESVETVRAVEFLKRRHVHVLGMTNDAKSKLAALSDQTLLTHAGVERVSATKTFTSTLALIHALTAATAQQTGRISEGRRTLLWNHLVKSAVNLEKNFGWWEEMSRSWAEWLAGCRSVMVVGRGPCLVAALQGALLLKEVAKVPAEGMSGGEFTHGPMEAMSKEIGVIVLGGGRTAGLQTSLAHRAKSHGARVLMVAPQAAGEVDSIDFVERDEALMLFPCNAILNLLTYFAAVRKGLDPDKFTIISKVTREE
jgi:glucosamine--fructose-6-phosphate aminotransferase (isomerizing)